MRSLAGKKAILAIIFIASLLGSTQAYGTGHGLAALGALFAALASALAIGRRRGEAFTERSMIPPERMIKSPFARRKKPAAAFPRTASASACEYIVIARDGSTRTFVTGTTAYAKGCEPPGGHKPPTIVEYED